MSSNVASPPTLSTAVLTRSTWLSEAILLGAGVLLVALSAQVTVHLPGTPVPISGQTFSVLLVGSAYGAIRGVATLALYLAVGIVGLPVFSSGTFLGASRSHQMPLTRRTPFLRSNDGSSRTT